MLTATSLSFGDGNEFPGGVAGIAAQEAQRRQARVKSAQTLFTAGSNAFSDQSYGEAMDYFKAAFDTIPSVPAVADQRRIFFKRYQAASLEFTRVLISEAKWAEAEATLAAVTLLAENSDVPEAIIDPEVKKILADIRSHDDRYNQAMSPQHLREAELVNSKIILGKGFLELGDYDRAERAYNEALAVDPYNTAARRGLENVERHKMNYADAAYDHTRAKMLRQVAAGWESPVPLMDTGGGEDLNVGDVAVSGSVQIEQKLKNIVIPKLEFNNARLVDVLQFLTQKSQELDTFETDPLKRGVNIVVDSAPDASGIDPSQRSLSVRISNVPLGVALQYVTGQVDMKYRVDAFAVTVVPMSSDIEGALVTRTYVVPPGFISGEGQGAGPAGPVDPFATPDEGGGGALVKRITAKDYLIKNGIEFGDGANARYIPATSKLVVRNTVDQQRSIEGLIAAVKAGGDKMVMVSVKMISIESTALNQLGMDFLLGQSNFGSTPRAFFGGGTDGNATAATSSIDYPIVGPGGSPVGMFPVTSGLRTGDVSTARTIDDIIQSGSGNPSSMKAPGIFGIAGVFTDPQFQMVLRGLSQLKASDTLCDVSVPAKPGQIAKIEQAREFIYPTEYDPPELPNQIGGVINGTSYDVNPDEIPVTPATPTAFETRRLGKVIEVEPTVSQDNHSVNVNITLDFSEFAGFINYGTPILNGNRTDLFGSALVLTPNEILMPVFDAVKETTNVDVWDGQTIAIGGLHGEGITTTNDKVPFIGDLPVLGRAFRSSTHESKKRAMLIFVTVRLVDPGGNPINDYGTEDELYSARDVPPPRSVAPVVNAPGNYVYPEK
ncbi:Amuc_1098 family type IV pilus outer membrane protein [Verrucomicrobiales bacterium BCK34]|nr:Amuc_1098 family type IV pilus outer membrane protein [Verrucomicrobiales bacterium BCK34]